MAIRVFLFEVDSELMCANYDSDEEAQRLMDSGLTYRELTFNEVQTAFGDDAIYAGDEFTVITGTDITTATVVRDMSTKTLDQYKDDLEFIYAEKKIENLTIDTREMRNSDHVYTQMTAYALGGMSSINWALLDGSYHTYTDTEFTATWQKVTQYRQSCDTNRMDKIAELEAATTLSDVDLTMGWPSTTLTTEAP